MATVSAPKSPLQRASSFFTTIVLFTLVVVSWVYLNDGSATCEVHLHKYIFASNIFYTAFASWILALLMTFNPIVNAVTCGIPMIATVVTAPFVIIMYPIISVAFIIWGAVSLSTNDAAALCRGHPYLVLAICHLLYSIWGLLTYRVTLSRDDKNKETEAEAGAEVAV